MWKNNNSEKKRRIAIRHPTEVRGHVIIVKKKRRIAIRHPTEVRGDVIIYKTI